MLRGSRRLWFVPQVPCVRWSRCVTWLTSSAPSPSWTRSMRWGSTAPEEVASETGTESCTRWTSSLALWVSWPQSLELVRCCLETGDLVWLSLNYTEGRLSAGWRRAHRHVHLLNTHQTSQTCLFLLLHTRAKRWGGDCDFTEKNHDFFFFFFLIQVCCACLLGAAI